MTNKDILDKTLCKVFKVEAGQLADLKFGSKNWDSIGHLRMIGELENEFGIAVSSKDIVKMDTYGDVIKVLEESYGVVFQK